MLPGFAQEIKALKADAWGPDQLVNGSFESDGGWGGVKLAHETKWEAAIVPGAGRNGTRALRLFSASPVVYQGKQWDWVSVNSV